MSTQNRMSSLNNLNHVMTLVCMIGCLLLTLTHAAPILSPASPEEAQAPITDHTDLKPLDAAEVMKFEATRQLPEHISSASPAEEQHSLEPSSAISQKHKRDSKEKTSAELETQETGHHYPPPSYPSATESDYGYDAGRNNYGKQASDWSLYDQGNHGLYDKYGDKAWKDQGHNDQSSHGKHDSYGNSYNSHGSGHGSGYYSRDRGYGYEKHYAYDKEVASKHHADSHNNYGSQHGLHDNYGNSASNSHLHQGHDKYGQASRYGNHGYGKKGSNLAANHDYAHNQNKAHYYAHSAPQSSYSSYGSHVPTYRSTYSDYTPQIGYPSSYPSYY